MDCNLAIGCVVQEPFGFTATVEHIDHSDLGGGDTVMPFGIRTRARSKNDSGDEYESSDHQEAR